MGAQLNSKPFEILLQHLQFSIPIIFKPFRKVVWRLANEKSYKEKWQKPNIGWRALIGFLVGISIHIA